MSELGRFFELAEITGIIENQFIESLLTGFSSRQYLVTLNYLLKLEKNAVPYGEIDSLTGMAVTTSLTSSTSQEDVTVNTSSRLFWDPSELVRESIDNRSFQRNFRTSASSLSHLSIDLTSNFQLGVQLKSAFLSDPSVDSAINTNRTITSTDDPEKESGAASLELLGQRLEAVAAGKDDPLAYKGGGDLAELYEEYEAFLRQPSSAHFQSSNPLLQVNDGFVIINAVADGAGEALLADLESLGLQNGAHYGAVISGLLPIQAIDDMVKLGNLKFASPAYQPITRVGATTSQGDDAMKADVARDTFGVDGSGVTVGVLSDSYDRSFSASTNANDDVASGDLPGAGNPNGFTTPITVLDDSAGGPFGGLFLIDEGRGMMQLIHDVAPGAELFFHTAFNGAADFAQGITDLVNAGADVIVDDIGYLDQPFFQDGVIAQAVDDAFAAGVPYFSSAGNSGRDSYESEFRPGSTSGRYLFHDFDPGAEVDIFQGFTLDAGESITLSFQWDEPFASVGGVGSNNDLDIFILDSDTRVVASSTNASLGGDAVEIVSFQNPTGVSANYDILIGQDLIVGGLAPGLVKYIDFDGDVDNFEYATNSSTSFGHPNAAGASAVGAAFYQDTPEFGVDPALLESFSSAGGTQILFDTNGNRLANPEVRQKVNIVAPDGTNNTFFGGRDSEGDGFPNFFGTSAASPHAAAVAALMLEAEPGSSPGAIYGALESTALDMDDPFTSGFDVGFDVASGFGLIQADQAIQAIQPVV